MNITSTTRTVHDYHLTLSEEDLATLKADPVEFAAELLGQLQPRSNGHGLAVPAKRKAARRAPARKTAVPKARVSALKGAHLPTVTCPKCGRQLARARLALHMRTKHSSIATDSAIAAA